MKKIYAIDFDGTLCRCKWPDIGRPRWTVILWVRWLQKKHRWILWTCREGDQLIEALLWCNIHGIYPACANENPADAIEKWGTDPRKVDADRYIDDKAQRWLRLLP